MKDFVIEDEVRNRAVTDCIFDVPGEEDMWLEG